MTLRLWVEHEFAPGRVLELPPAAVRHVQVRRLQPGDSLTLFDGHGKQCRAELLALTRHNASVSLAESTMPPAESAVAVTVALGVPTNERMDMLVEKATELGVAALQPLLTERSVLRLTGERAERRRVHWQAVAGSACEQCGRATVPLVHPVASLQSWMGGLGPPREARWLLSPRSDACPLKQLDLPTTGAALLALSGPEGGLSEAEEAQARALGFIPASLGPRILRADTAPLALLAWIGLHL
jgi:16S rRNA (uracil1498-N3)-methyltransferase